MTFLTASVMLFMSVARRRQSLPSARIRDSSAPRRSGSTITRAHVLQMMCRMRWHSRKKPMWKTGRHSFTWP